MNRSLEQWAELSLLVAREAGQLARVGWRSRPRVFHKGVADLVTEYDLASERLIRERLAQLAPGLDIVGEEEGGSARSGTAWYCDPIDGTTNFAHGHPFWAVSVALVEGGQPLVGAVVAPCLDLEWVGWGGVARRNGVDCRVSVTGSLADSLCATGFPRDMGKAAETNIAAFERTTRATRGVRRCGSAAIDLCLVADGTYDGYWEHALGAWDVAAGIAIIRAAGGTVTHLHGGPPRLDDAHVLATNGRLHEPLSALLNESFQ